MTKELILSVVIKREREGYSSWCPELDVASQGDSIEEARKNLQEAVELHVETMVQNGDLQALLDKLGLTTKDLQKETILPEFFSGPLEIPLAV
ncbi:MAG TPA: type II toxin-antitoxin system HicB family antitoxin [Candidatus Nanoarchaeia archaeon]|nr:type II toxin-antitoxin system HicB family antitoxin [Candidatus Nanoarchaeia archaeon]